MLDIPPFFCYTLCKRVSFSSKMEFAQAKCIRLEQTTNGRIRPKVVCAVP